MYMLQAITTEKHKHINDTNVHIYKYFEILMLYVIFGEKQIFVYESEFHISEEN